MLKKGLFIFVILLISRMLCAQSVGLVLSGGGAKGLAHIGVIKALEEMNIPIDYIGGTSMGAIVGALYAIGLSTDEMVEIIESDEFEYWMSGKLVEEDRYYFKEDDPGPDLVRIGLDVKDTLTRTIIPMSIIPSKIMDFAFMEIFARGSAAAGYDFDSLFVPFLCNAADISASQEVVFRSGDLSEAVRASMTVPLYFRPIVLDGSIMYDGGIFNNFPVNHVDSAFAPDIVIGSKAAEGNSAPHEFDILKQIENIVMKPSSYHIDSTRGVLLDMNFSNPSLLAFNRLEEYLETGYQTTMAQKERILSLVERRAEDSAGLAIRREKFQERWPEFRFGRLEVSGLDERQEQYVQKSFQKVDSVMNLETVRQEYLKLSNDKALVYLYPRCRFSPADSLYTLKLRVIPEAPLETRFGLFISTTGMAQTYLGLSYREIQEVSTHLKASLQFGRLYDGANLGFRFDYPSRIPVYFKGDFNYNRFDYNISNPNFFFEDLKPSYVIENEINFRFDVGMPYKINSVLKTGVGVGRNNQDYFLSTDFASSDTADRSVVNQLSWHATLNSNTLNNKQYATRGSSRLLSFRLGYGQEHYQPGSTALQVSDEELKFLWASLSFRAQDYVPLSTRFRLGYYYCLQASFMPMMSNYLSTIISSPVFQPNLISQTLFMEEYRAHQFMGAGLMPTFEIRQNIHAKFEAYAFVPVQKILRDDENKAYKGSYFPTVSSIFTASINVMTVAGPMGLHAGYLGAMDDPWVFQLSFGYLLFNKKSDQD